MRDLQRRRWGVLLPLALTILLVVPPAAGVTAAEPDPVRVCVDAPTTEFTDAESIWPAHRPNVSCLAAYGITVGLSDGRFDPGGEVTRMQLALFVGRLLAQAEYGVPSVPVVPAEAAAAFTDLDRGVPAEQATAIHALYARGIVQGVTATTYDPGASVSREQLASFVARSLDTLGAFDEAEVEQVLADFDGPAFTDLDAVSAPHAEAVRVLQALEVIGGFEDGAFRPGDPVSRQQLSRFLLRAADMLANAGHWQGVYLTPDPSGGPDVAVPGDPDTSTTPGTPGTDPDADPDAPPGGDDSDDAAGDDSAALRVTPADDLHAPSGVELDLEVRSMDASVLTVQLVAADDDGPQVASSTPPARIVAVDGRALSARTTHTVEPVDGRVAVTVRTVTAVEADAFALLVTDDAEPATTARSGIITVANPAGIALRDGVTGALLVGSSTGDAGPGLPRPAGTTLLVTAVVYDAAPALPGAAGVGAPLALADGTLHLVLADLSDESAPAERCEALAGRPGQVPTAQRLASTEVPLDEGTAAWSLPPGAPDAVVCLVASWRGSGPYLEVDPVGSFRTGPLSGGSLVHGLLRYVDAQPVPDAVRLVDDPLVVAAGASTAVHAEVVDQFAAPLPAWPVSYRIQGANPRTATVTTDTAGRATLELVGVEAGLAEVQVEVLDGATVVASDQGRIVWYLDAAAQAGNHGRHAGELVAVAADHAVIRTDDGEVLRLDYGPGDRFRIDGAERSIEVFRAALTAGDDGAVGAFLGVVGYPGGLGVPGAGEASFHLVGERATVTSVARDAAAPGAAATLEVGTGSAQLKLTARHLGASGNELRVEFEELASVHAGLIVLPGEEPNTWTVFYRDRTAEAIATAINSSSLGNVLTASGGTGTFTHSSPDGPEPLTGGEDLGLLVTFSSLLAADPSATYVLHPQAGDPVPTVLDGVEGTVVTLRIDGVAEPVDGDALQVPAAAVTGSLAHRWVRAGGAWQPEGAG